MPEDMELEGKVTLDKSEIEELEREKLELEADVEADTSTGGTGTGAGGGAAAGSSGRMRRIGLLAILGGILATLKPITELLKLILRVLMMGMMPILKMLAIALRPLVNGAIEMQAKGSKAISEGLSEPDTEKMLEDAKNNPEIVASFLSGNPLDAIGRKVGRRFGMDLADKGSQTVTGQSMGENVADGITFVLNKGHQTDDMSDEGEKETLNGALQDFWRSVTP